MQAKTTHTHFILITSDRPTGYIAPPFRDSFMTGYLPNADSPVFRAAAAAAAAAASAARVLFYATDDFILELV